MANGKTNTFQGTIRGVEVVHRKNFTEFMGPMRRARIVVWATTARGKRVWIRTVEGELDQLNIGIKIVMAQEFFGKLVGYKIRFHQDKWEGKNTFFAEKESLPDKFRVSYPEIKKVMWRWVKTHYGVELDRLQTDRMAKAAETRKKNAERDVQADLRRKAFLEERRKNALHATFIKGRNPKYGTDQWEARHEGRKLVLRKEDRYDPTEGSIPIENEFDLIPDKVILVRRI